MATGGLRSPSSWPCTTGELSQTRTVAILGPVPDSLQPALRAMRASDADRETVAGELRIHCVAGRITPDELDKRLAGVMASLTVQELAEIMHDLPTVVGRPEDRPADQPRLRIGPPGNWPFTRRLIVPATLGRTHDVALDTIAPALNRFGYELMSQSSIELKFERSRGAAGRVMAVLLFFPFGLLALLVHRQRERIVISLEQRGAGRTNMIVHGRASRRVRKAFAQLDFSD